MDAPHRRYELKLELGADSWEDILSAWNNIEYDLSVKADKNDDTVRITSGGVNSGYTLRVDCDTGVTHDSWYEAIQAYLAERKAQQPPAAPVGAQPAATEATP